MIGQRSREHRGTKRLSDGSPIDPQPTTRQRGMSLSAKLDQILKEKPMKRSQRQDRASRLAELVEEADASDDLDSADRPQTVSQLLKSKGS